MTDHRPIPDKRSRFRGCLLGGAVGDALGYPIEFQNETEIFRRFGNSGIRELSQAGKPALISDDTQMTLFAAEGIMIGDVWAAYREWLGTQGDVSRMDPSHPKTRLFGVPRLHARRAPGNTCLSAIRDNAHGGSFLKPLNNSKGCGTVMRAAPYGLCVNAAHAYGDGQIGVYKKASLDAVLTHGHPMAILSSNALAQVIYAIAQHGTSPGSRLETVLEDPNVVHAPAAAVTPAGAACEKEFAAGVRKAVRLALDDSVSDLAGIHALGAGWVAEEAFFIAAFCAVRYQEDFAAAIRASVNHSGDSDSTGAICGNILGAWLGEDAVREAFDLRDLELADEILRVADELYDYQDNLGTSPSAAAPSSVPASGTPETDTHASAYTGTRMPSPDRLINYYEFPNGKIVKHIIDRKTPAYDPVSGKWARVGVFRYIPDDRSWKEDPALTSEFAWDRPYGGVCQHLRSKADISEDLPALPDLRELSAGSTFFLGAWPQYEDHDWSPVQWRVLEVRDGCALCISSRCLINTNYCDLDAARDPRSGALANPDALTWQKSLARQKCRGFFEDAFSAEEQALLVRRKIPAGDPDVWCEDRVFLLSEAEIARLLPSPQLRQAAPTPAVLYGGARCGWSDGDRDYTSYWLLPEVRGEGMHTMIYPKAVFHDGEIRFHGRNIYHRDFTVRPCILLKMQ